ncbi:sushi, von Willebrand factor type A, EGF and pentraxin domain-containing protein 1-like isoform X1 [Ranitomeya imitator]|uniref:sushi, von Willebrand factor type A, EGF and pentraxin domain-containing protein 1-like isoform X1 n=1 Tax=Ranitomeya imitator TaxID=111125 RepID=UPI0037E8D1A9
MSSIQTTQWNFIRIMLCSTLAATIYSACPRPPPLAYAVPNADNDTYNEGDKVNYSCSEGYNFIPSITNIATCGADGSWTKFPEAFCRRICPNPQNLSYAIPSPEKESYVEGDNITYSCLSTYQYIPGSNNVSSCGDDGQWSTFQKVFCKRICPNPQNLSYAVPSPEKESYVEGDNITYSCLSTYQYIPGSNNVSSCGDDGKWSTFPKVFCKKLDCHMPDILQNGKVEFLNTVIGSNASYKCEEGYKLFGSDTRYCLADEKWNGTVPSCNRTCPEPPILHFAIINSTTNQIAHFYPQSSKVVYSCISGFIPSFLAPLSSTCQSDFKWSKIIESCIRVSCGSPGKVENGDVEMIDDKFQSKAFFFCNSGYKLVGNPYRECLEEGIWSGSIPTCQRSCPDPPVPKSAQIIQMPDTQYYPVSIIIVYSCLPGYKYDPFLSPIIQCLEGFTWSNLNEFCKKVICGEPERIRNGNMLITGTDFGSIAVYSCSKGYKLIGNSLRKCTADSIWGGNPPACQAI